MMREEEFLSSEFLEKFAIAYAESFPELHFNVQDAIKFIATKFPLQPSSDCRLLAYLASENGEIASGYGVLRRVYSSPERTLKVGLVCDVFTSTRYRKQGLFKKVSWVAINREEEEKTDFLIGFPIRDEVMPGHLSVGWKYLFNMNVWWVFPKVGITLKVRRMNKTEDLDFARPTSRIKLIANHEFLENRFKLLRDKYYVSSLNGGRNFVIFRKAKLKGLPFTCIVHLQASDSVSSKKLLNETRKFALFHGTLGVLGCWNSSFADSLFVREAGLRKSRVYQKVITRDLNGYESPISEKEFELSWLDSDTL
jgi:hypothetical protein